MAVLVAWAGVYNVQWGRVGSKSLCSPLLGFLLINTGKARWLISRALALGFYPDMGGDAEMLLQ